MLRSLGLFTVRRRRWILLGTVVFLAVAGYFGGGVADRLSSGGFADPDAESTLAADALEEVFDTGEPNVVLLVTAQSGTVDGAEVAAAGAELTAELGAEAGVAEAASYWTLGSAPPLRSTDATQALVLARIAGTEDDVDARIEEIGPAYTRSNDVIEVRVGGGAEVFRQVGGQVEKDLARGESVALPITFLLLVVVFGSLVAAFLPLAVGGIAILGTFLALTVVAALTEVSIFSLNLTTMLGLGLSIDYSLFIVSRYREELGNGLSPADAVVRTVETAGRTVLFSGITVAISLSALLVFPLSFLRSFAYAGVAVVMLAAAVAVLSLPALLAVLGHRVDSLRILRRRRARPGAGTENGFWHRVAMLVMRRPVPIAVVVTSILLVLGAPFLGVNFGLPDDRVLPEDNPARSVQDDIRANFTSNEADALVVIAEESGDASAQAAEVGAYAATLSSLPGVARVDAMTGSYIDGVLVAPPSPMSDRFVATDSTWLSVVPAVEAISGEGETLVHDVRATPAPFEVKVGGPSAQLVDSKASLFSRVPLAAAIIGVVTFVMLFLLTGSIVVPIKAIVLNLLSLTATFGAIVWVFQDGHFASVLGFTPTGTIDTTTPILMFCIAFGLSMDYEVFLLSRIKEEYDRTGDPVASVAVGLERTGRIVTAAALLLSVVLVALGTSQVSFIQLLGLGLALAVVMDATLIRATLVPAFMRLAGRANWWAPAPLRRLHNRFGITETEPVSAPAPEPVGAGR